MNIKSKQESASNTQKTKKSKKGKPIEAPPSPSPAPASKVSLLMPANMTATIEEICKLRGVSLSDVIREVLDTGLPGALARARGIEVQPCPASEEHKHEEEALGILHLRLNPVTMGGLCLAAESLNVGAPDLVQLVLTEHLPAYIERGRRAQKALAGLLHQQEQAEEKQDDYEDREPYTEDT